MDSLSKVVLLASLLFKESFKLLLTRQHFWTTDLGGPMDL